MPEQLTLFQFFVYVAPWIVATMVLSYLGGSTARAALKALQDKDKEDKDA